MISSLSKKKQLPVIGQLLKASNVLLTVLREENNALTKGIVDNGSSLVERKVSAINAYTEIHQQFIEFCRLNPIDNNSEEIKQISELMSSIAKENDKNEHLLRINIDISEKIISAHRDAQEKNIVNRRGYNNQGKANTSKDDNNSMPAASLNDKI